MFKKLNKKKVFSSFKFNNYCSESKKNRRIVLEIYKKMMHQTDLNYVQSFFSQTTPVIINGYERGNYYNMLRNMFKHVEPRGLDIHFLEQDELGNVCIFTTQQFENPQTGKTTNLISSKIYHFNEDGKIIRVEISSSDQNSQFLYQEKVRQEKEHKEKK